MKGRWEMSGIRIGQGYRTAKGHRGQCRGTGGRGHRRSAEERIYNEGVQQRTNEERREHA